MDKESRTLNTTTVSITANSNKALYTSDAFSEWESEIELLLKEGLFGDPKSMSVVFGAPLWIHKVTVKSFGPELGSQQHRAHFHMVVEILHRFGKYSIRKLRERFKSWLNENYGASKGVMGWNIYFKLVPTYQSNYANKESRWALNDLIEESVKPSDPGFAEKERLEDDRPMSRVPGRKKEIRVLQGNEDKVDSEGRRDYNKTETEQQNGN